MARIRTVDLLPEIFQTDANRQFLAATLDTLVQEPKFKKTQGFIGRTVGPGVVPEDKYVVEPTKIRADYQLEPGVVSLNPRNTNQIQDAITWPGILEGITARGGAGSRPDRLSASDYYTWDPFCDFDAFVNFSQYYWLPNGPDPVDVSATGTPITDTLTVTRANGVYSFSGVPGDNPTLQLVRGGSYVFDVAQNSTETVNFRVSNQGVAGYTIDGQVNPAITLVRGNTYVFNLVLRGPYPFWIKTQPELGTSYAYNNGVTRNGSLTGLVTFTVPQDAPDTLYYVSENQTNLRGQISIVGGTPGTGAGFWIQTEPGISGVRAASPNISSREVVGVINNGEDLGTVIFNVPTKTQQEYYYNLPTFSLPVDLITNLAITDMQGQSVDSFNATYGGIDGITSLDTRTLIFVGTDTGIVGPDSRQLYQINYSTVSGVNYINVAKISDIPTECQWLVKYGDQYSNTGWYKTAQGTFREVPALTAALDTLWYQDGTDPGIVGRINLVEPDNSATIYINDILGKAKYTSPNGVVFTNGLKVVFRGDVVPAAYGSNTVPFVCTATTDQLDLVTTYDTSILYEGQEVIFAAPTIGGLEAGVPYYVNAIVNGQQFTVSATPGGNRVTLQLGSGTMDATALNYREYYVAGVGTSIQLLPVTDFVTPERYVVDGDTGAAGNQPSDPDYITIDRASPDLNAWSRSNRWFHIDVIQATATYNSTIADVPASAKARRPIIQFRSGLRLYNMGTQGKQPVDVMDFDQTDAFSNVEGATSYSVYGYQFVNGTRVIFANDSDDNVRNRIYQVEFIYPDTIPPIATQPVIHLVPAQDSEVLFDQSVVILNSGTANDPIPAGSVTTVGGQILIKGQAGYTYWYDGENWNKAQLKTSVQQAPLFDVYDSAGISFGNMTKYPSTNFVGSKLFSYAVSDSTVPDVVLRFPLRYLTVANVGDIVFDNNLYTDSFIYTRDNTSAEVKVSTGFPREYSDRTTYERLLGWQTAATTSLDYQQFRFVFTTVDLELDVPVSSRTDVPVIKIYINGVFQDPSRYIYTVQDSRTLITLNSAPVVDSVIEVLALSDETSELGFYQVPINLQNNPFNSNSSVFTLGTVRQHYQSICENLVTFDGSINGANNTRDLGAIGPYGLVILQQSAPLTLTGYFTRSQQFNLFNSLVYNGREYTKYKNLILENVTQQTINFQTAAEILDTAIENITAGRVETQPFYWSDMLPSGAIYQETNYTISFITTDTFDTLQVYDYQSANYLGMNVYLDGRILTRNLDYVVATDGARITVLTPLTVGQVLTIREYTTTAGSFCPNTPTKLGLYPAYQPRTEMQTTSNGEQLVIIGHDGSATKVFGDIRDDVLLEFERRIYNNLKLDGNPVPLSVVDVLPGQFRTTGYSLAEVQNILDQDFLSWVAWNKLDYKTQQYDATNAFTYNYSASESRLNNGYLPGAWRGINRYFYDTLQPESTPWEMLGFSVKPTWWDLTYGEGPYTDGNLVLWDDLEAGIVRDPLGAYVLPAYVRPGLTQVIPSGSEGALLPPLDSVVGTYDAQKFEQSWSLGDGGPVEASWWNSSLYPFAVMRLLALTRPAKFFSLFADRDLYRYSEEFGQYLYNGRYRLDANGIQVYGNGVSKASFINWIVDYNHQTGLDSTTKLEADLANLDVRLCYRMASFSDKQYIKLLTEKSTPDSTNTGFTIPDASYQLLLYKNQPFAQTTYSAVIVQKATMGYQVFGYSTLAPYFTAYRTAPTGRPETISAGGETVRISTVFTNQTVQVPYSTIFDTTAEVCEFLLGYGRWLQDQGFTFDTVTNGYPLNWQQMAVEFLYWAGQGWEDNTLISLNPLAQRLQVSRPGAIADSLAVQTIDNVLLDQNRKELPTRNLNIVRLDNTLMVEPLVDQALSYVDLNFTSYEHMIVLNNRSEFGDLIYDPVTGARQYRLTLIANNTTEWNGNIDAQGFILNRDNVEEWTGLRVYAKGEVVRYKGSYWSAANIVQPGANFDYNDWLQSDYEQIEQGLLPNLANKAQLLETSYDVDDANLDSEQDLFSYGLIGFRPRQYLAALNLDDVSQVNVYRQFLGSKGTILSAENLRSARLSKEEADYDIYENWAVQRGVYGANANRSFFELRLNRALLNANPSTIQVVNPVGQSQADQAIQLGSVWRESYKLTSPNILPVTTAAPTDTGLPSAGYVNLEDADITVFDINDPASLAANLNSISVGTTIWVAKINSYDWNVYRAESVPGSIQHLCDNLDGTSLVIFSGQHGLTAGDKLIIRFFDAAVDGVYDVLSVPNLTTVTIAFQFPPGGRTVIDGTGIGFTLKTMRVGQFSDVINLPYANQLTTGTRVWADDNGGGLWAVYEKQDIFSATTTLAPRNLDATENYGSAVALAVDQQAALVGSPRYGFPAGPEKGAVYTYVKNFTGAYQPVSPVSNADALLQLTTAGARAYGASIDFGRQDWAVAGAPNSLGNASQVDSGYACVIYRDLANYIFDSNPYVNWQLLTTPGDVNTDQGQFGQAVAMSADERWLYVSAPYKNDGEVYAYTRVEWQDQNIKVIADGTTTSYDIGSVIQIDDGNQLLITVGGAKQTLGVDYTVDLVNLRVDFTTAPLAGLEIVIRRLATLNLDPTAGPTYDLGQYFFQVNITDSDIYSFQVELNGGLLRPNIDYTFNSTTKIVNFSVSLNPGDTVTVRARWYWLYVATITCPAGSGAAAEFGYSLSCTTDGRQVLIGARSREVDGQIEAGCVYVYDRDVQRFQYGETSTISFAVLGSSPNPLAVSVLVNGSFLSAQTSTTPETSNSFAVSGNTVTVFTDLTVGDFVEIETNQFSLVQTITQQQAAGFSNYGQAVDICSNNCSLYVGAPQSSLQIFKGGVVERLVNQSRLYGIIQGTVQNPTVTPGHTLRVNNQDVAVPAASGSVTSLQGLINNINSQVPNVTASLVNGQVQLSVTNSAAAAYGNKLQVSPGTLGTTFDDLGFETFVFTQTILSPYPVAYAGFGGTVTISDTATELVVAAPSGSTYLIMDFDQGTLDFDANSTIFFNVTTQSGAVYVYDYLPATNASVTNPDTFVLGQQIAIADLSGQDHLGQALSYVSGVLFIGSPGSDVQDSSLADYGRVYVWQNPTRASAWTPIHVQQPTVDIRLLNSVFLYNLVTSATTEFLDFFNPLQGKVLGAARQNIDYISAVDPAGYNAGPTGVRGNTWGQDHVGETWWDITTVRFLNPEQDNITYASRQWGQVFPGSSVDVYQWIVSDQPPAAYTGPGTPHSELSYVINLVLTDQGTFQTQYFFWVRGLTTVATNKGKTLSVATVSQYIQNPRSSGIAYLAPINANTVAIYNCDTLIEAQDTVLHIEFDRELTDDNVHVEYELIPQGRADGFLTDNLYRKMLDSFCGVDTAGNLVPDITLSPAERYGVQFRPRQSMFTDRFAALRAYIIRANQILTQYPISEIRSFALLNSQEPIPASNSGAYNKAVANTEILGFQNIYAVPLGYRYLVLSDSTQSGLWTIYTVESEVPSVRELVITRVQNYRTPDYWSYVNWYLPGYNSSIRPTVEVPNTAALDTLTVPVGTSVKVTSNAQGKFEIYLRVPQGWQRVGLEDGTIAISAEIYDYLLGNFGWDAEVFDAQYFDQYPTTETRRILQALNEEIFVDELLIYRNELLVLTFNFVLSEFSAPEWLVKTSLVDVDHRVRGLLPFPNYLKDNQEFVIDYIQEVKPYHVQVREFNLRYDGQDSFAGDITDFDLPAYWNTNLNVPQFTSPILLPYLAGTATGTATNINSDQPADAAIWSTWPWNQWYNNFLLLIDSIQVVQGGSGYTAPPQVTVVGDAAVATLAKATIADGAITAITITRAGSGYRDQPTIVLSGGNGTGALAWANLRGLGLGRVYNTATVPELDVSYNLARSVRVGLKFDRCEYVSQVQTWSADGSYAAGTLVRYNDRVWEATPEDSTEVVGPTFDLENWTAVPASTLSGVDRTMGFYVAGVDAPGLDLPLLVDGISYPGVQVWGDYFVPDQQLDAAYQSNFTDLFLGTRPTDINVVGGKFIDPYEGHAPEELVNGSEFDTMDMRVYTRAGSDWQRDGHGFRIGSRIFTYVVGVPGSWAGLLEFEANVLVSNTTTNRDLTLGVDYVVNWADKTVEMLTSPNTTPGDNIQITVYGVGGGSELYRADFLGRDMANNSFLVPVSSAEIQNIMILIDGVATQDYIWDPYAPSQEWTQLDSYAQNDVVTDSGSEGPNYYRAIQPVPVGVDLDNTAYWLQFTPTLQSRVTVNSAFADTDNIAVTVMGLNTVAAGDFVIGRSYTIGEVGTTDWTSIGAASNTVGETFVATSTGSGTGVATTNYSWSTAQVQNHVVTAQTLSDGGIYLTNYMGGTNVANMVVTRNGLRLTPPSCIEWTGDGTTNSFGLPQRMPQNWQQSSINAISDIQVWVDDVLQVQNFGDIVGDYGVTNWDGSNTPGRQVIFAENPPDGARIVIAVWTLAGYRVSDSLLQFAPVPNVNDLVTITSWNDTAQQDPLTQNFYGPVPSSSMLVTYQGYDTTVYSPDTTFDAPGSFDYSTGTAPLVNNFDLGRVVPASRLWVTLDGQRLFEGEDYTMVGSTLILASGTIAGNQVLTVLMFTNSIVPEASAFRIFQDMRGVQATYRITQATTTQLVAPLAQNDDVIYVADASGMTQPDLANDVFGVVTIGGERITYRERDVVLNTLSGLRRGTAGTAADSHNVGDAVYNIGRVNLLSESYQDYVVSDTTLGDGNTTVFYAPSIVLERFDSDSSVWVESIEVYVGGVRQYRAGEAGSSTYSWIATDYDPVAIEFVTPVGNAAPPEGAEVTVLQRRGTWWYDVGTPAARAQALQENDSLAARFLTDR